MTSSTNATDSRTQNASSLAGAMVTLIALLIIVLNLAVIVVLILDKKLRSDLHCMVLLSLSISDFLVGLTCMSIALQFHSLGNLNLAECFIIYFMFMVSSSTSLAQVTFICVERIIGLKFPHKFRNWFSFKKICLYIAVMWVSSCIVVGIPSILWIGTEEGVALGCEIGTAYESEDLITRYGAIMYLTLYCTIAVTFGVLIRMLHDKRSNKVGSNRSKNNTSRPEPSTLPNERSTILTVAINTAEPTTDNAGPNPETRDIETNRKVIKKADSDMEAIKALGIVIIIVTILIVPTSVVILIDTLLPNFKISSGIYAVIVGIGVCNALCDPFVYALTMTKFKTAIRRIQKQICPICHRNHT